MVWIFCGKQLNGQSTKQRLQYNEKYFMSLSESLAMNGWVDIGATQVVSQPPASTFLAIFTLHCVKTV